MYIGGLFQMLPLHMYNSEVVFSKEKISLSVVQMLIHQVNAVRISLSSLSMIRVFWFSYVYI